MNPQILRNAGFFLIGGSIGFIAGKLAFEKELRAEYEESQQSLIRALERQNTTFNQYVEAPRQLEEHLVDAANTVRDRIMEDQEAVVEIGPEGLASAGGDLMRTTDGEEPPPYINHYAKALATKAENEVIDTPIEMFVEGTVNEYGISYIEEDDFDDDDGRFKGNITIVLDNHEAAFFMDGVQIQDWADRIGNSILADFYQFVPPNAPAILYVRNHKRDEDYEVSREIP